MRQIIAAQCINCGHVDTAADGVGVGNCPRCSSFELHRWPAEEMNTDDEVIRIALTDSGRAALLEVQE